MLLIYKTYQWYTTDMGLMDCHIRCAIDRQLGVSICLQIFSFILIWYTLVINVSRQKMTSEKVKLFRSLQSRFGGCFVKSFVWYVFQLFVGWPSFMIQEEKSVWCMVAHINPTNILFGIYIYKQVIPIYDSNVEHTATRDWIFWSCATVDERAQLYLMT